MRATSEASMARRFTNYIGALLLCLVSVGCLQPAPNDDTPVNPLIINNSPPVADSLAAVIRNALSEERQGLSALALLMANNGDPATQEQSWVAGHLSITTRSATTISTAIKSKLTTAITPEQKATVWKEVAQGYAN